MSRCTPKQGQYVAFIYYAGLNKQAAAEADIQRCLGNSPPSVHQMVLDLDRHGLIQRTPGRSRSIRLLVDCAELPDLD